MMRGTMVRLSKLVGLCSLVLVAGCFQIEEKYIVYSDGSGKLVKTMTMDQSNMEMMKNMAPPGSGGGAPGADITKTLEGTMGQKVQMGAIAYFEDVTKVKQPGYNFAFTKRDDGGIELKLDMDLEEIKKAAAKGASAGMPGMGGGDDEGGENLGETPSDEGGDEGGEAPGGMGGLDPGMMEGFMSQMKQSIVLVLPGDVTSASMGEKNGRVVTFVMEGQDLSAPKEKKICIEASCGAPTADAKEEFEAFQKELDAAKAGQGAGDGK